MSDDVEHGPEKLDLTTPNFTDQNIARIADLFPNVVSEGRDEDGNLKHVIDFDALKQELSGNIVEGPQERYHLNWPGKRKAILAANAPINKTLRPCREESVDFDTTKNLFIEGDNLDALKLLQETYLGKVKMIYIDPPYNTGKDFIYKDNFTVDKDEYLEESGQRDEGGGRLVANPESNGRYHSDWLSMMLPRLRIARNLLREDGVAFISIGEDEQASLKNACDEIFGVANFLGCACRVTKKANNQGDYWSPNFDYVLTYSKSRRECPIFSGGANTKAYDQIETEGERRGEKYQLVRLYMTSLDPLRGCVNQRYFIEAPDGTLLIPPGNVYPPKKADGAHIPPSTSNDKVWRWSYQSYLERKDKIVVKPVRSSNLKDSNGHDVKWNVFTKTYLNDVLEKSSAKPNSLIESHINQNSSHELNALDIPFPFAKPSSLIEYLCEISKTEQDDIVLDFFAGSASTAHGVLNSNMSNAQKLRFIMVQLPEVLDEADKDQKEGVLFSKKLGIPELLTEVSKERIRRAGTKILEENPNQDDKFDVGFRTLKIESSNMTDVWHSPESVSQDDLLSQVSNIKPDRTGEDLLFQVLLDWGVDLTLPIARESIQDKEVFLVDGDALAACFETGVSEELVKQIADRNPLRVVFRDDGFDSDATKINVEQLFKHLSPHTEVKVI